MFKILKTLLQTVRHIHSFFYSIYMYIILVLFKVQGNKIEIIRGIQGTKTKIRNYGYMSIGNNTVLSTINPIGDSHPSLSLSCSRGATLRIGSNTGISHSTIFAEKQILIGNNVMIGADCKVYDWDFHPIRYQDRIAQPDTHTASAAVEIKDGAWIGAHSIILKGSIIGKRAVIGAGSVVAGKVVGDDEIWAGNPCRFIKKIDQ